MRSEEDVNVAVKALCLQAERKVYLSMKDRGPDAHCSLRALGNKILRTSWPTISQVLLIIVMIACHELYVWAQESPGPLSPSRVCLFCDSLYAESALNRPMNQISSPLTELPRSNQETKESTSKVAKRECTCSSGGANGKL